MKNTTKMVQASLFNIPFWKIQSIEFKKKKKKLVELLKSFPEEKKEERSHMLSSQEFVTNRQSDRSGFVEEFASIMNQELEDFSKEIKSDFAITEIWSISYNKHDNHSPHNHGSVGLSGILYLNLPKDSPDTTYMQPWNDYKDDITNYASPLIAEGDIIIVPSFVRHFSKPNKSKSKKRIIAWDMKMLNASEYQLYENNKEYEG